MASPVADFRGAVRDCIGPMGGRTKWCRTKCRGQNVADKMVRGQNVAGQNVADKMSRTKCRGQNVADKMSWIKWIKDMLYDIGY